MKGLKTYFTYLHRNKLFTLVNVVGLGISLMFVLLIANMVVRQLTVGRGDMLYAPLGEGDRKSVV